MVTSIGILHEIFIQSYGVDKVLNWSFFILKMFAWYLNMFYLFAGKRLLQKLQQKLFISAFNFPFLINFQSTILAKEKPNQNSRL